MQIERYPPRQKRFRTCSCAFIIAGLVVVLAVFAVLAAPRLPAIALRIAGFEPAASTRQPVTAAAIPIVQTPITSPSVLLSAAGFGQMNLPASPSYSISIGKDDSGADTVQIAIRAEHIRTVCLQHTDFCGDRGHPFRRAKITLGSGSLVMAGEAFVELLNAWQAIELGVSLRGGPAVQIDTVGFDGAVYGIPDNVWGRQIGELEADINQTLRGLSVQVGGRSYALFDIIITEYQLVAVFR